MATHSSTLAWKIPWTEDRGRLRFMGLQRVGHGILGHHSISDYEKTIGLTIQTFVGKVMALLFNMLARLVIAFLPRSKCLLFHGCSHHLQ